MRVDRARRRRRLRHQGPRLSGGRAGARGRAAPGPAGEVDRDAARALPHRLRRSRPGRTPRGSACGATGRSPRCETTLHARSRRLPHARRRHDRQHDEPSRRALPRAALSRARRQHRHPQELRRRLSRRRPAGGRARARSPARSRRARDRHGSRRPPPPQPHPPRADAVRHRPHLSRRRADHLRPGRLRRRLRRAARAPRLPGWRKEQAARRGSARPIGIGLSRLRGGHRPRPVRGRRRQRRSERPRLRRRRRRRAGPGPRDDAGPDLRRRAAACRSSASSCAAATPIASASAWARSPAAWRRWPGPAVARSAREVARKARLVARRDVRVRARGRGRRRRRRLGGRRARPAHRRWRGSPAPPSAARRWRTPAAPGLGACVFFYPNSVTWAFGAQAAVVEVDLETCTLALAAPRGRARLRTLDQSDGRRGPGARRHRAGAGQRAAGGGRPRRPGPARSPAR